MPLKKPSPNRNCGGSDLAQQPSNGASFKVYVFSLPYLTSDRINFLTVILKAQSPKSALLRTLIHFSWISFEGEIEMDDMGRKLGKGRRAR
ncbi:hypothetical protein COLO4_05617 [Corchorus olitorius]|uniref:Uncharacterized protein n=1 Tax=Corchorus olitorius TaxID=93759 RepID=A0A1R3KQD3_9ROSI|nr:hypothetical protein COLO4_05617 [Corchorus olitorius]